MAGLESFLPDTKVCQRPCLSKQISERQLWPHCEQRFKFVSPNILPYSFWTGSKTCPRDRLLACRKASAAFCMSASLCWAVTAMHMLAGVLGYALSRSDSRCTVNRTPSLSNASSTTCCSKALPSQMASGGWASCTCMIGETSSVSCPCTYNQESSWQKKTAPTSAGQCF